MERSSEECLGSVPARPGPQTRRRSMRKRLMFPALLAVVLVASVLAAGSQAMTDRAAAPKATTVTLNGWQVSPAEETKLQSVVSDFNRTHSNIKIDYQSITGDYQAQMLAKFAARKPPDVFYVDVADIRDWVGQGVIQPLDSYVKEIGRASCRERG